MLLILSISTLREAVACFNISVGAIALLYAQVCPVLSLISLLVSIGPLQSQVMELPVFSVFRGLLTHSSNRLSEQARQFIKYLS
jgi:hypothetical protein